MARCKKPNFDYHAIRMRCDKDNGELVLVNGSRRNVYIWANHDAKMTPVMTFTGPVALRRFAKAVLAKVGDAPSNNQAHLRERSVGRRRKARR